MPSAAEEEGAETRRDATVGRYRPAAAASFRSDDGFTIASGLYPNTACAHDIDAEFVYPSDSDVLDVYVEAGELRVALAIPFCPECGTSPELETSVETVAEGEFELPLDDDRYD